MSTRTIGLPKNYSLPERNTDSQAFSEGGRATPIRIHPRVEEATSPSEGDLFLIHTTLLHHLGKLLPARSGLSEFFLELEYDWLVARTRLLCQGRDPERLIPSGRTRLLLNEIEFAAERRTAWLFTVADHFRDLLDRLREVELADLGIFLGTSSTAPETGWDEREAWNRFLYLAGEVLWPSLEDSEVDNRDEAEMLENGSRSPVNSLHLDGTGGWGRC